MKIKLIIPWLVIGAVLFGVGAAIVFPLAVIWAINQLFNTTITYTFWNWLAVLIMLLALNTSLKYKRNS
jgi:hypothetical protein